MEVHDSHSATNDGASRKWLRRTIELARENVRVGGRPFSCLIVLDGAVIAEAVNEVEQTSDATAHAEVLAVRKACQAMRSEHLPEADVYVLAHPCPMCLTALYYVSPRRLIFQVSREKYSSYYRDGRRYFGFSELYGEICLPWQERRLPMRQHLDFLDDGLGVFANWAAMNGRPAEGSGLSNDDEVSR